MSFESTATSLTNLSSVADRMQPFDEIDYDPKQSRHHKQQKKYIRRYLVKAIKVAFVLSSVIVTCYLVTAVHYLQSMTKDNKPLATEATNISATNDDTMPLNVNKTLETIQLLVTGK